MSGLQVRIDRQRYGDGSPVLQDLELRLGDGEIAALLGPSGAGKTTLLSVLAGLEAGYEGEIRHEGSRESMRIGMVFQDPRLLPWLSVRDNITLVLHEAENARADELLAAVHLSDRKHAFPSQLSGGMQRRVALARAFAVHPELLLLDEPFVSLDVPTARALRELLLHLWETLRPTVVLVSHDQHDAIALADRLFFLSASPARVLLEQALPPRTDSDSQEHRRRVVERILADHPDLLAGTRQPARADRVSVASERNR